MNSNIFKIFLLTIFFISCKNRIIENTYDNKYQDLDQLSKDIQGFINNKKTGIFIYPKVGYVLSLKKGKLDGEISLIRKQDTIYYCKYKKNKPIGNYISNIYGHNHSYGSYYDMYYSYLITVRSALYYPGKGFYNKKNQKEGFWDESGFDCIKEGTYSNGLKNGIWIEECFNDGGAITTTKIIKYKMGVIIRTNNLSDCPRIDWWSQSEL